MKRTILYINSVPHVGGAEASMLELAAHLDPSQFTPVLLTTKEGELTSRFRIISENKIFFGSFPFFSRKRPWVYWNAVFRIIQLIRSEKIALVHVNCDQAVPHAVVAGRLAGVPVLCHVHDMVRAWYLPRYVRYMNQARRIIADSQATARHCLEAGMRADKLQVIYECFDMEQYLRVGEEARERVREEWGIRPEQVAIGLVGHILRYKGHEEFIRAAEMVHEYVPDTRFIVVGDDHMSDEPGFILYLEKLVSELGLGNEVVFTGYRNDISQVMKALDILAVPTYNEAFGRVVVESLSVGRPVVASNTGGIPEIIEDNKTGLLVPPKDPQALAEALIKLSKSPELREEMGKLGIQSAQRFDIHLHTQLFERTYRALLEGGVEDLPLVPFGEATWGSNKQ